MFPRLPASRGHAGLVHGVREQQLAAYGSYGMGAAAADFDNDGWPDIYVACDTAPSLFYRNNHDGTFREIAVPAGCAFDENGVALPEWAWRRRLRWRRLAGHRPHEFLRTGDLALPQLRRSSFEDASIRAGLGVNRKYVGFGVGFFDFDNDGWKDLFIANGHVYSQIADRKLHVSTKNQKSCIETSAKGDLPTFQRTLAARSASPIWREAARLEISTMTETSTWW